jgi:hypothetical protein
LSAAAIPAQTTIAMAVGSDNMMCSIGTVPGGLLRLWPLATHIPTRERLLLLHGINSHKEDTPSTGNASGPIIGLVGREP